MRLLDFDSDYWDAVDEYNRDNFDSYPNEGCFETLAEFKRRVVREATEYEEKRARKVHEARKRWLPPDYDL